MLVPRIPPSADDITENMAVKKLQSNASQPQSSSYKITIPRGGAIIPIPRLPSSFEIPDHPLEDFSRCCNIATRQILIKNPSHILPFELTYSTQYPQEIYAIAQKKAKLKLQEQLNWIRHSLSANGEPDYSFIMLKQREKSTRTLGYAYMKMSADMYLKTLPSIHKTYSVPPITIEDLAAWLGAGKKMTKNALKRHQEIIALHKESFTSKNPHLLTQEKGLYIVKT